MVTDHHYELKSYFSRFGFIKGMSCCPSTHRNATSFLWHIGFNRSQGEVAGGGCGAPAGTGWQEIPLRAARGIAGMCAQVTDQHFGVLEGLLTDLADQQLLEVVIVAQRVLLALLGGVPRSLFTSSFTADILKSSGCLGEANGNSSRLLLLDALEAFGGLLLQSVGSCLMVRKLCGCRRVGGCDGGACCGGGGGVAARREDTTCSKCGAS